MKMSRECSTDRRAALFISRREGHSDRTRAGAWHKGMGTMMTWRKALIAVGLIVATLWMAPAATATGDFETRLRAAQDDYRVALNATRGADGPDATRAIRLFVTAMDRIVTDFPEPPPPRFGEDPQWSGTMEEISGLGRGAVAAAEAGDIVTAHDHLELIRKLIRDLRRRNGVLAYSDIVSSYHIEVESVLLGGYTPATFSRRDTFGRLREQVGVLEYLAVRLERDAPFASVVDPDFHPLVDALFASIDALRRAIIAGDKKAAREAMDGLLPAYWAFFLKFG